MEGTPVAKLIHEFHQHRIGATIEDEEYADADTAFFDDIVKGTLARAEEIDAAIVARLASGWSMARLDRTMKAILRAGTYELIARGDVPVGAAVSEYVDVAKAFFDQREAGFARSEEHTSELQSLMRISYAVFCLKKKKHHNEHKIT